MPFILMSKIKKFLAEQTALRFQFCLILVFECKICNLAGCYSDVIRRYFTTPLIMERLFGTTRKCHRARWLTFLFSWMVSMAYVLAQSCQPALPNVFLNSDYKLPAGKVIRVNSGDNLQTALNVANAGDVIEIEAGATFAGNFTLRKKTGSDWIYIRSVKESLLPLPGTRISPMDAPNMPKILAVGTVPAFATEAGASNYRLVGLEIGMSGSPNDQFNLVNFGKLIHSIELL